MLNDLKRQVCKANKELMEQGVVRFTWGNVSGFDPSMGLYVIKPSGVPYDELQPELMVVMSMEGTKVEGRLEPSVDSEIHRAIYMAWPFSVAAVAHTHSTYAVAYAQAGLPIPPMGTTHADYFGGAVPVTRALTPEEIKEQYEYNTGNLIVATAKDPEKIPAVLVERHGPFVWGKTPMDAVKTAVILEEVAKSGYLTRSLNPQAGEGFDPALLDKHFSRRNGAGAYYGQK
ncbi:MAG: L-ribulose-5-phosphate 4-epimerase AraD [Oscillospiraceae bacterium]|jgi:L-ribulose-5-phosphate 4-epimerase|nr:L-ribulose-5-phosphate 4-epimerase AraD [Oscillospiraceae bacterium]